MSAGHTPGPWKPVAYPANDEIHIVYNDAGNWLASVWTEEGGDKQADADAALIAAAPELLQLVCQYASDLKYPPTGGSLERRFERIGKVIAKATGAV